MNCIGNRWSGLFVAVAVALALLVTGNVVKADVVERSLLHDGFERWFLEVRSSSFVVGNPVLINLHGARGNMYEPLNPPSSLKPSSEANGYMMLTPNAMDMFTNATRGGNMSIWNCGWEFVNPKPPDAFYKVDDVGFLTALAKWAVSERGADPNRVYLMGVSNGGGMVHRALMETFPPVYAAAASFISTLGVPQAQAPKPNMTTPLFAMMGTKDRAIPYQGGILGANIGMNAGTGISAQNFKDYWIAANKADAGKVQSKRFPNRKWLDGCRVESQFYPATTGTINAAPFVFYTVTGGGHAIPSTNYPRKCWLRSSSCPGFEATWGPICVEVNGVDLATAFMAQYTLKVA